MNVDVGERELRGKSMLNAIQISLWFPSELNYKYTHLCSYYI